MKGVADVGKAKVNECGCQWHGLCKRYVRPGHDSEVLVRRKHDVVATNEYRKVSCHSCRSGTVSEDKGY